MAYIFQMRRGERKVDAKGETLKNEDGTPVRDDWGTYSKKSVEEGYIRPQAGELLVEFEATPAGKKIPRLKIGDGIHDFPELDYIGLESFIFAPAYESVTLAANAWINNAGDSESYYQQIRLDKVTANSKVDIQLSPSDLVTLKEKQITFTTVNDGGTVSVHAIGQKPEQDYTIYATITEVS